MKIRNSFKNFWKYLKRDSWDSWLVSIVLAFLIIKLIFFPTLSFITSSDLPLVVVESCSMYHGVGFDKWWEQNGEWYEKEKISKEEFVDFALKNGLNKGDVVFVWGHGEVELGDIIIFNSNFRNPLIHRVIDLDPIQTKGDNNFGQLEQEKEIYEEQVIGKAVARVPGLGWLKLIFFEPFREEGERGFCR